MCGSVVGEWDGWCDADPNQLVLTYEGCYLCGTFGESRLRNATVRVTDKQTDRQTDRHRL